MSAIFVSHAAADRELAHVLVDVLRACGVPVGAMYCTSVEGLGVETGDQFTAHIRGHLAAARLVVLLVTPMFVASRFCSAEMGAAWALGKPVFPLVVEGAPRELGANMVGTHTQRLNETGLDHLHDRLRELDAGWAVPLPFWTVQKRKSLRQIEALVPKLQQPPVVPRAEFEAANATRDAAIALSAEADAKLRALQAQYDELERAKDATEARAIRARHSGAEEEYERLRADARDPLAGLNRAEVRVLFAAMQGQSAWVPGDSMAIDWDEVQAATNRKTLEERDVGGRYDYAPNRKHPRMAEALSALEALAQFLATGAAQDVISRVERDHEIVAGIDSSEFWSEQLLNRRPLWT